MGQGGLIEEELTRSVIGAFFEVYNELGFGFAEHVHVRALSRELLSRGHRVARELDVPVDYKGEFLCTQRIDVVVDNTLIVETKSTEALPPTSMRQLQNYLRCTDIDRSAPALWARAKVLSAIPAEFSEKQKNKTRQLRY